MATERGVTRYIIGLGNNFRNTNIKDYLEGFASRPPAEHTVVLKDFAALQDLFTQLQRRILSIEGAVPGSSFSREFSSAGLSATLLQGSLVLGDPGIYEWSGGILNVSQNETLMNMSRSDNETYGYLGYSVRLLRTQEGLFCVAGAPRYDYRGQVTLLRERTDGSGWEEIQRLQGEQVGSYFGSEIALSDMDRDGLTDLLFLSAPHYQEERRGGRVSVCLFSDGTISCPGTLRGELGHPLARFGAAVSTLWDLDGDGLSEVAVGAPDETDGRGALYIFKGESAGVRETYSQRVLGPPGGRGFGLSIHGVRDMTGDGLTDIAVGSWGHVTLHRSRPLLNVTANVTFDPQEIPIPNEENCKNEVTLRACVYPEILTPQYTGPLAVSLFYSLILDSGRLRSRVSFRNRERDINETVHIRGEGPECQNFSIALSDCSLEDVSPVRVSLGLSLTQGVSQWLLSPSCRPTAISEVPFQQSCGSDDVCEPDLSVSFQSKGDTQLVVRDAASLSVFLELQNTGEDGHLATLRVTYPPGLSFRKANVTQASYRMSLSCRESQPQNLMCNVSHPVLRHGARAGIQVVFDTLSNISWAERVQIEVTAISDNERNETFSNNTARRDIPVLYPINVITKGLAKSIKYINFSNVLQSRELTHGYQIRNLQPDAVTPAVTISVVIPVILSNWLEWDVRDISGDPGVSCVAVSGVGVAQGHNQKLQEANRVFQCSVQGLNVTHIHVKGELRLTRTQEVSEAVSVSSNVTVQYNKSRYHSLTGGDFLRAEVVTHVELLVPPNYTIYIIGGTAAGAILLLLISVALYKCGFFKRYKDRMNDGAVPNEGPQEPGATDGEAPEGPTEQERLKTSGPREPLTLGSSD
ncbi:integrin alpha-L-like [Ascaphus truei]|uniref:integrin alpha-L-like n=1 Tax=Ascaphus truei TaxID=8439 RepID=UPI003F5A0140